MDTLEIIEKLAQSDIVQSEIPLGFQLGLPWFEKRGDTLLICFNPHKEELTDEDIEYYTPQYGIAWIWPFEHLAYFRKSMFDASADVSRPVCKISVKRLLSVGKYGMDELYREGTRLLAFQESNGMVTDAWIIKYQKKYQDLVNTLGLQMVYGKEQEKKCL